MVRGSAWHRCTCARPVLSERARETPGPNAGRASPTRTVPEFRDWRKNQRAPVEVGVSETGGFLSAPSRTSLLRPGSLRAWQSEYQRVSEIPACPFEGVELKQ